MSQKDIAAAAERISKVLRPEPEISKEDTTAKALPEDTSDDISKEDTTTEEQRFTVKVGDEELSLTLEELRLGYMRGADYQQKTTKAKQLREQYEAQTTEFTQALEDARRLLDMDVAELENNSELREDDPEEYLRLLDSVKKKQQKFNQLKEKERKAQEAKQAERLKREQEKLKEAMPDWVDPDKQKSEVERAIQLLSRTGYTDEELMTLSDHRLMVLAHKAALYDEIKTRDLKKKEVKEPVRVASPGGGAKQPEPVSTMEAYKQAPSRALLAKTLKEIRSGKKYR